jgi:alpha-beta hydrolase superfamily lysophospholipase
MRRVVVLLGCLPVVGALAVTELEAVARSPVASVGAVPVGTGSLHVGTSSTRVATSSTTFSAPEPEPEPARRTVVEAGRLVPVSDSVNELHATFVDRSRGRVLAVTVYTPAAPGAFPIVLFAHGFGTAAAAYAPLEQAVAAAGFVVVAPDFPRSSTAITSSPVRDPVEQATDVSFLLDVLLDPASRPPELVNVIADGPVGVIGHSDGGITAAGLAFNSSHADTRVGAVAVLSGANTAFPGTWFSGPSPALLAVHGDADAVNPYWASEALFDGARGPKWLVTVAGGSHDGPFTVGAAVTAVGVLVADFLRAFLSGDANAGARVSDDAQAGPLALTAVG